AASARRRLEAPARDGRAAVGRTAAVLRHRGSTGRCRTGRAATAVHVHPKRQSQPGGLAQSAEAGGLGTIRLEPADRLRRGTADAGDPIQPQGPGSRLPLCGRPAPPPPAAGRKGLAVLPAWHGALRAVVPCLATPDAI